MVKQIPRLLESDAAAKARLDELEVRMDKLEDTAHQPTVAETRIEELEVRVKKLEDTAHGAAVTKSHIEELETLVRELEGTTRELLAAVDIPDIMYR
jgi:uncharacterized coiled-coil protein SlyX